jgi:hypothetical protein
MKYLALGLLGAILGVLPGAYLGVRMNASALQEAQASIPGEHICGLMVLPGMIFGGTGGILVGAIIGAVIARFVPDPAHAGPDKR